MMARAKGNTSCVLGIDLGTTNSCAATIVNGSVKIIPNRYNENLTPSVIRMVDSDLVTIGSPALRHAITDPAHTIRGVKRLIGRSFSEIIDIVHSIPYVVVPDENENAAIDVDGNLIYPEIVQALILRALKDAAEAHLGRTADDVIIGVPAYFNRSQREATRVAGLLAGFDVFRIVDEPTLAAFGYDFTRSYRDDRKVAVFDIGGGTFDITILDISSDGVVEVIAIDGDGFLGGDDFDDHLLDWVIDTIGQISAGGQSVESTLIQHLLSGATAAKCALSSQSETVIQIPEIFSGRFRKQPNVTITNADFLLICEELFERLREPCIRALAAAKLKPEQLDYVLLVGGASRMRHVNQLVLDVFKRPPARTVNPDEAVAVGAAVQSAILHGIVKDFLLLDVFPHAIAVILADGSFHVLVPANTTIPTEKKDIFKPSALGQRSVEAVIVEGDSGNLKMGRQIGVVRLENLPTEFTSSHLEVRVTIGVDSAVTVTLTDLATKRHNSAVMNPWKWWTPERITAVRKDLPLELI